MDDKIIKQDKLYLTSWKKHICLSKVRTTIETAFYGNNVAHVQSLDQAYQLALQSPGTIVTDMPVYNPTSIGLSKGAKVLLNNYGAITGRCSAARKIIDKTNENDDTLTAILREAIYQSRYKKLYYAQAYIGLDHDFMMGAHLLIPDLHAPVLYNWLLNFQYLNETYKKIYENSKLIENEGDILVFSDPDWTHPDYPYGLTLFDPEHNCAALLGMRYFGEHKKGTLTLAWSIANRNGFAACHGGLKVYEQENQAPFAMAFFGLSGSGKSTLTHADHDGRFETKILHDDAFVISTENSSSVALEPSYFDKTQDYPPNAPANQYLISVQNCGATRNQEGELVVVTEDLRNGNGRAIKSKLWTKNRIDRCDTPVKAIAWLMKDPTLPPCTRVCDPRLAAVFGATLATKRSSAERILSKEDLDALVIEPYANPFRTYPLNDDYTKFIQLFSEQKIECYILNTGHFGDKKIDKYTTLSLVEDIVTQNAKFVPWGAFPNLEYVPIEGFIPNMSDQAYVQALRKGFAYRMNFLSSRTSFDQGRDQLDESALNALKVLLSACDQYL